VEQYIPRREELRLIYHRAKGAAQEYGRHFWKIKGLTFLVKVNLNKTERECWSFFFLQSPSHHQDDGWSLFTDYFSFQLTSPAPPQLPLILCFFILAQKLQTEF